MAAKGHGVGAGAALPVHLECRDFHGEAGSQRRGADNILPVVIQDISKDDVVNQRGVNTGAANSLPDSKGAQVRRGDRGQSPSYLPTGVRTMDTITASLMLNDPSSLLRWGHRKDAHTASCNEI